MFARRGNLAYRLRFAVLGTVIAGLLTLGAYGFGLGEHLSSGGLDDPNSESAQAARLLGGAFPQGHDVDVVVLYTAPPGKTVDDPDFSRTIVEHLDSLPRRFPGQILGDHETAR